MWLPGLPFSIDWTEGLYWDLLLCHRQGLACLRPALAPGAGGGTFAERVLFSTWRHMLILNFPSTLKEPSPGFVRYSFGLKTWLSPILQIVLNFKVSKTKIKFCFAK